MRDKRLTVGDVVRIKTGSVFLEQEAKILAIKCTSTGSKIFYILDTNTRTGRSYPAAFEHNEIEPVEGESK